MSPSLVLASIEPDHVIGLVVAVGLLVYLVAALLGPDRF